MSETRTAAKELQDDILSTVSKSQAAVIDAIQTWTAAVQSITPALPDVNVPFAEKLPRPAELVASAYDFAEQLLANQRKFAEEVLQATTPLLPGKDDSVPAKKSAPAAK
jgi:hypothetical protein